MRLPVRSFKNFPLLSLLDGARSVVVSQRQYSLSAAVRSDRISGAALLRPTACVCYEFSSAYRTIISL